jgi:hypothetical protein
MATFAESRNDRGSVHGKPALPGTALCVAGQFGAAFAVRNKRAIGVCHGISVIDKIIIS